MLEKLEKNLLKLKNSRDIDTELFIESITHDVTDLEDNQKKLYLKSIIKIINLEQSEQYILNLFRLLFTLIENNENNKYPLFCLEDIFKVDLSPKSMSILLKYDFGFNNEILDELILLGLISTNSEFQNQAIKSYGKNQKSRYKYLLYIYLDECIEIINNETILLSYNSLEKKNISIVCDNLEFKQNLMKNDNVLKIDSRIPEILEYNEYLKDFIENHSNCQINDLFNNKYDKLIKIKGNLIVKLLNKSKLLIETLIKIDDSSKLYFFIEISKRLDPSSTQLRSDEYLSEKDSLNLNNEPIPIKTANNNFINILNITGNNDIELLTQFKSSIFHYLGKFGDSSIIDYLNYRYTIERDNFVKIAIIHAIGKLNCDDDKKLDYLLNIAKEDVFYFHCATVLLSIGGERVEDFILSQFKSTNFRKIVISSFFIPYMNNEEFREITLELFSYKQPMIIKQALWIVKKKKYLSAMPNIISFLFSEDIKIKMEAMSVFYEFGVEGLNFLKSRKNYYKTEKREILSTLISDIENYIEE